MKRDIKTKKVYHDIKTNNRSKNMMWHVKESYLKMRRSNEAGQEDSKNNPTNYAEGRIQHTGKVIVHKSLYRRSKATLRLRKQNKKEVKTEKKQDARHSIIGNKKKRQNTSNRRTNKKIFNRKENNLTKLAGQVGTTMSNSNRYVKLGEQYARRSFQTARNSTYRTVQTTATILKDTAKTVTSTFQKLIKSPISSLKVLIPGAWGVILILLILVIFGTASSMIGSSSSTEVQLSAEVIAYRPLIRQYAEKYGISEYVELILAVMMQESGGRGLDPMQASECMFNTKYPNKPGGITNPEYSIDCGIQELRNCLQAAEVQNPIDLEHIKLALQGYNYGNGYISWAVKKYGGYSAENAAEFSDMMAQKMGWSNYGDKLYVSHVLRYYPLARLPNGGGNHGLVEIAISQEGNSGETYWRWYGFNSRVEWCACFVSWCGDKSNLIDSGAMPKFSSCSEGAAWFKKNGSWRDSSYMPVSGDIIFFDWDGNGTTEHVGIIEKTENGRIYTIEGNNNNSVRRVSYPIGYESIYGYGVMY